MVALLPPIIIGHDWKQRSSKNVQSLVLAQCGELMLSEAISWLLYCHQICTLTWHLEKGRSWRKLLNVLIAERALPLPATPK